MIEKEVVTFTSWVSRPVFLSSTFKDMQAERDHLNKVVFPELAERLRARHVLLEPIDLRQGVETSDAKDEEARELLTLKVCLDEIDKSRPLLIVLLGDRYGWTPPKKRLEDAAQEKGFQLDVEGKSVTALEIEYGLLKKNPWLRTNSLFLFREPLPYAKMPKNKAEEFSEEYSKEPNAQDKVNNLKKLKQKIKDDHILGKQVRPYSLTWDEHTNRVTGLEAWGDWVKEEIWKILDEETKDIEQKAPKTWEEEEKLAIEDFIQDRSKNFVGREDIISELKAFAHSEAKEGADWGACVTAGPGTGKSALFAKLYREFEHDESVLVLSHAVGITPKSGDVDSMLLRWITELSFFLQITTPLPEKYTQEDLDNTFASLLSRSSVKKRVVVLIDALNQFNPTTRSLHMTWLKKTLPANIRFIATAIVCDASKALEMREGMQTLTLEGPTEHNAEKIISAIYKQYHRDVNAGAKNELMNKIDEKQESSYTNPLWLNLAVEQLNLLDADDFALAQIEAHNPAEHIAKEIPGDVPALYEWILTRLEKTYGAAWVVSIIALVALSRQGWREMDFEAMLPVISELLFPNQEAIEWDPLKFAVIRRGLRGQLIQSGSHGRWRFMHQQMQEAVLNHISKVLNISQSDTEMNKYLQSLICDYLLSLPCNDPIHVSETMWHLIKADDKLRASRYYGSELSGDEENQATNSLLVFIENQQQTNQENAISWVCSLLKQEPNNHFMNREIVNRFRISLNSLLGLRGNLITRRTLLIVSKDTMLAAVASDPGKTDWQRDLSFSYIMLGDVNEQQGNLPEALINLHECMKIREQMTIVHPENAEWQRDLTICYNILGDIYRMQGRITDALGSYEFSAKLIDDLIAWHKLNPLLLRDKALIRARIGSVHLNQRDLEAALREFQLAVEISENLYILDPNNWDIQIDLYFSYRHLGEIYLAKGEFATALNVLRSCLEICNTLTNNDPSNTIWQNYLFEIYSYIGDIYEKQNNYHQALDSYLESMKIIEKLAYTDSTNAYWKMTLSISYRKLGIVKYHLKNYSQFYTYMQNYLVLAKELLLICANNHDYIQNYSNALYYNYFWKHLNHKGIMRYLLFIESYFKNLSAIVSMIKLDIYMHQKSGEDVTVKDNYNKFIQSTPKIFHQFYERDVGDDYVELLLAEDANSEGICKQKLHDLIGALDSFNRYFKISQKNIALYPNSHLWNEHFVCAIFNVGEALYQTDKQYEGIEQMRQGILLAKHRGFEKRAASMTKNLNLYIKNLKEIL